MPDNSFAEFLDSFRKSRNMSRTEFVEGIVSTRQYQRFVKGQSSLSSDVIIQLMDRLELVSSSVIQSYTKEADEHYHKLTKAYDAIYSFDIKKANTIIQEFDNISLTTNRTKKLYSLVKSILLIKQDKVPIGIGIEKIMEIIDYPDVLTRESINYIEASGLLFISNFLLKNGDNRFAEFSYNRIIDSSSNTFINDLTFPFYIKSAQLLGSQKEFKKSTMVTDEGIKKYIYENGLDKLTYLYCLKALGEKNLYDDNRFMVSLKKVFALLFVEDNENRTRDYETYIKKSFKLSNLEIEKYRIK